MFAGRDTIVAHRFLVQPACFDPTLNFPRERCKWYSGTVVPSDRLFHCGQRILASWVASTHTAERQSCSISNPWVGQVGQHMNRIEVQPKSGGPTPRFGLIRTWLESRRLSQSMFRVDYV